MRARLLVLVAALGLVAASASLAGASAPPPPVPAGPLAGVISALQLRPVRAACAVAPRGSGAARCDASVLARPDGAAYATSSRPAGYGPAALRSAYRLPATGGTRQTVAIVDAYNDPNAATDLATYRAHFGLPACAAGCFRKVNQAGLAGAYPADNAGWATEISLDTDMVSAVCPSCRILLVEASSASSADLLAAVDTAVRLGATEVSNSYGTPERGKDLAADVHLRHPGVAITASSGDSGYGVQFPAASPDVTAVGGTTLTRTTHNARGWMESAWSGSGSGCSVQQVKPAWQQDKGCGHRTVADVAAVADPSTGVAVYDSYGGATGASLTCVVLGGGCPAPGGWFVAGGTSVGAPLVAAVYALAGGIPAGTVGAARAYATPRGLWDVSNGSNGGGSAGLLGLFGTPNCGSYLCNSGPGYDGPTGLGTPKGTSAF